MTDSERILQASKVSGCFGEIMDGNLMLSNGSDEAPEAVSTHFEITIDFVDEWLGRNVEALVINNVCVRLSDRDNDLVYPEAATIPSMEAAEEDDEAPIVDADEHDEVSAEATVMEVVEPTDEEEADEEDEAADEEEEEAGVEVPAIAAFELSRQASLLETAETEDEEAPASHEPLEVPSYSARIEPAEEKRIVWPPFEDEEEEEPAETPSNSYALSQSSSEPRTDDYRSGETEHFRF